MNEAESPILLDRFSLRFTDEAVEQAFRQEYALQSAPIVRMALIVGAVVYALFGVLDFLVAPDHYRSLWLIRFGIVIPSIAVLFAFTYNRHFHGYGQSVLSVGMVIAGAGIVGMTAILPPETGPSYYSGLILVMIYCSTLIRLTYRQVLAVGGILVSSYVLVTLYVSPAPKDVLIGNTFFLVTAAGIAVFIAYLLDYYIRSNYRYTRMLLDEKARKETLMLEAQAASRSKTEFLANMSHELRTPLNAIIGFSEVMREEMFGALGSTRYQAYADDIFQSGNFLLQIIDDILDTSKAEIGTLTLHESDFDLAGILDQSLRLFRDQAASAGLRLRFVEVPECTVIHGDERLLRQALMNVVSNALKFTQQGGEITVSVRSLNRDGVAIDVSDTGTGITPEDIERVTQPFVQLENPYTREYSGTGLGLALAKRTLELHDGQLRIQSRPGVGTTVSLLLPSERIVTADPTRRVSAGPA